MAVLSYEEIKMILKMVLVIFNLDVNTRTDPWNSQIHLENTELEWHEHTIYLISKYLGFNKCPALCCMLNDCNRH